MTDLTDSAIIVSTSIRDDDFEFSLLLRQRTLRIKNTFWSLHKTLPKVSIYIWGERALAFPNHAGINDRQWINILPPGKTESEYCICWLLCIFIFCFQRKKMGGSLFTLSRRRDKNRRKDLFSSAAPPEPVRKRSSSIYQDMERSRSTSLMKAM